MILKAGTYRFNAVLNTDIVFEQSINFYYIETFEGMSIRSNFTSLKIELGALVGYQTTLIVDGNIVDNYNDKVIYSYDNGFESRPQEHTVTNDTEVDDTFGTWYIANTNYNEVNTPQEDTEYIEVASWYTSVANAIRSKKGTTAPILRDNFASEIELISVGADVPEYDGTVIIEKAESLPYENGVIKAGTYRFNDTLDITDAVTNEPEEGSSTRRSIYEFEFSFSYESNIFICLALFLEKDGDSVGMGYFGNEIGLVPAYNNDRGWMLSQEITIPKNTEADDTFGTWFNANVKAVSV